MRRKEFTWSVPSKGSRVLSLPGRQQSPLKGTRQEHVMGGVRENLSLKDLGLSDSGFPLSL